MKWAKLVEDPEKATQKASPEDRLSIRYISQRDLDSFGVWKQFKFPPNFKATAQGKRDYQMMVGGYLLCYDYFLRSETIDHCLYLKWEKKDKKAKDDGKTPLVYESLTLLLWPKPVRKSSRTASLHQESMPMATPAPDDEDGVDPPTPPPPPPPTLEPDPFDVG